MNWEEELKEKFGKHCPEESNCNNGGTLSEHGCDGTIKDCDRTCPIPVQCEFCYCEPLSLYNLSNNGELINFIHSLLKQQRENIDKINGDIYKLTISVLQSKLYQDDSDVKNLVDNLLVFADYRKCIIAPEPSEKN